MSVLVQKASYDTISKLGLAFTLNDCKLPVPVWFTNSNFIVFGWQLIMPVKTFQVRSDNPSNDQVYAVLSCLSTRELFRMKIVCKFMFDGPQRAGTKFDLIGQLNVAWLLGHSWGSASRHYIKCWTGPPVRLQMEHCLAAHQDKGLRFCVHSWDFKSIIEGTVNEG